MDIAITLVSPKYGLKAKVLRDGGYKDAVSCAFGQEFSSGCRFILTARHCLVSHFRKRPWSIRSTVDGNTFDPPGPNNTGRRRLIRAIQDIRTKLAAKIQGIKKDLPMKLFFFLAGFYCATAFSTVIGQTGDWDVLSAALAVFVVECIGALMYKTSLPLINKIRDLINMSNYWKAGLSLGLFLDSFKYEMDSIIGLCNPFNFDLDVFSIFL